MQAFVVSIIAGWFFPMLPIVAEYGLTRDIQAETVALTGIVYAAAVGMASRSQAIAFLSLFCSTMCAVIYGAVKYGGSTHDTMPFIQYGTLISTATIYFFAASYLVERVGRHIINREPFLEF
jgi:hypothetical protein